MGTVYLARDTQLDRPVALKVLPSDFAAVPELRARFMRETRLAAGFSHPNIVPVFAIEDHDDVLAFAMGFVEGESLAARVAREGPLAQRDAVRLLQDVAYALAYAHGRDVVHRDIKPDNIMIERATSRALVMDFGIARAITPVDDRPGLTRIGEVVGTPEYMSPEQAVGDAIDGRADLYSLGLVAWFALVGRAPITGDSTQQILVRQLTEAVPPLASVRPDLPAALCAVVDRCCVKDADDRYPDAEALVEALDATQLAVDVPVSVRLLVPDLTSVLVRAVVAPLLFFYGNDEMGRTGNVTIFMLSLIALALLWVRALSTRQELRRLVRAGFTVDVLQRLFTEVQSERDAVRAQRRLDPDVVRRRRRRVLLASALLLWQGATLVLIMQGRIGDGAGVVRGRTGALIVFGTLLGCAMAITVLASSPFRRPAVEQLFCVVWLGRVGRALLTVFGGKPDKSITPSAPLPRATTTARSRAAAREPTTVAAPFRRVATPPSLDGLAASIETLQERVARLEDQRGS